MAQLSGGRPHTVIRLATAAADHRMETDDTSGSISSPTCRWRTICSARTCCCTTTRQAVSCV
ncbi:hypothetical protein ACFW93_37390 [Streptomyces canus]|uniref:hypothetical protein n=1 Tax=Streptomyces canus TaxID=58343 RepID=UPI0036D023D4